LVGDLMSHATSPGSAKTSDDMPTTPAPCSGPHCSRNTQPLVPPVTIVSEGGDPWAFLIAYPPAIELEPTPGAPASQIMLLQRYSIGIYHPPRPVSA
jgi:hypothetical protein